MDIGMREIAEIVAGAYILAQTIARITPTPTDDRIVNKIGKVLNLIFLKSSNK